MPSLSRLIVVISTAVASLVAAAIQLQNDPVRVGLTEPDRPKMQSGSTPNMGREPHGLQPKQAETPILVAPRNPPGLCSEGRCPT
jgi:hypothetical protein